MSSDPFAAPDSSRLGRDPTTFQRVVAIILLVSAGFEILWTGFTVIGMLSGAMLTVVDVPGQQEGMGLLILVLYGVWFVGALVSSVMHLIGGLQLLGRRPNRKLLWGSAIASIGAVLTIYCAPFGLVSAILLLVWLTKPASEDVDGPDPDILD